ncbi:MAG: SEC-C domain-containing protein [Candidatus Electrothrix sp. AR3]|nr:SEC-C domain-containing protein [Candidatus Electrothrix sp. AR3]
MEKTRRNQSCPCRSGKKYKHCCLIHKQAGRALSPVQKQVSLMGEIKKIQQTACLMLERVHELGVFVFFSMKNGDAWVLETTDGDAIQVAKAGQPLQVPVTENIERIEVDWSHTYILRHRKFFLTAYSNGIEAEIIKVPTSQIHAAMRRIKKQYPEHLLQQVHLNTNDL